MATTPDKNLESVDNNVNEIVNDEVKKALVSPADSDQGGKTTVSVDDSNKITQPATLSTMQSTNEDLNSKSISVSYTNLSDTPMEKKNEKNADDAAAGIQQDEESESTRVSPKSTDDNKMTTETVEAEVNLNQQSHDEDSKKDKSETNVCESKPSDSAASTESTSKLNTSESSSKFSIEKGFDQYLTSFQREKAKFFFNVNLDIENKHYVTWDDVEFYLLFHVTAAGKEGFDGGDLEARLSRATRAFWEFIHDQIPLPDGKRDTLTLDQFLDTWASLVDYVVRTNQLPPIVQDLVKLGFELYATNNNDGKPASIQPIAFDQLFQKMNLGRTHALMAHQFLTENGTKPLDIDRIESIVKAIITSSNEEHDSHFLLPGFFKVMASNKSNEKRDTEKPSSPTSDSEPSEVIDKPSPKPATPPPPPPSTNQSSSSQQPSTSSPTELQKPNESSPPKQESKPISPQTPQKKTSTAPTTQKTQVTTKPSTSQSSAISPPKAEASPLEKSENSALQAEDECIRRLLRYYHIDDGDIVEVASGSPHRMLLIHPEKPIPPYIQENPQLLKSLKKDSKTVAPVKKESETPVQKPAPTVTPVQPKITLQERQSRGTTKTGPTIPAHEVLLQEKLSSVPIRQVHPPLNESQQGEQLKQAKLQAAQSLKDEKKTTEDAPKTKDDTPVSKPNQSKGKAGISQEEEEKLVEAIIKRLTPIVERQVAEELHRINSGETDQDEDDNFMPFPFIFGGGHGPFFAPPMRGPPPPTQTAKTGDDTADEDQDQEQQQQLPNIPSDFGFGGFPPGAAFIPPPLLMAMMSDLARGGMGGEIPLFPSNMPPPPGGPGGVPTGLEGFMMFVDGNQTMGDVPGPSARPQPHF